ncbi:MAG TPA: hypothetical protein VHL80_18930 [Polyangia bacterium]|nr:hypothetical protein [Polyangia bacterium]
MGNIDQQRGKQKPPHRGPAEDARKQHAPSRHGHDGHGQGEPRRGAHHGEERREPSETDFPNQQRTPSEELSRDEEDSD